MARLNTDTKEDLASNVSIVRFIAEIGFHTRCHLNPELQWA